MNDIDLLHTYEPIIHYTKGERFFPCAIDEYLKYCSLWIRNSKGQSKQLIPETEVNIQRLIEHEEIPPDHTLYLRFVPGLLDVHAYQEWIRASDEPRFSAAGRLSRVGLLTRIIDSFFDMILLLRGRVPRGTAMMANFQYHQMRQHDDRYVYYGRVVRENGYIILHYMYFYAMNDWRSTFYGVNDHEADWEQVFVYLSDEDEPKPLWVAVASHDYYGDNLRRRWDDPELHKRETHPIIYVGAGSHAGYYLPGEYLTQVQLTLLKPMYDMLKSVSKLLINRLRQGKLERLESEINDILNIPFVDYARGDGMGVGWKEKNEWVTVLLTEDDLWVERYRGLWGLDTKDPFGGERAPAGPKYNRDGMIRMSWHNPLGWAGLQKVALPSRAVEQLKSHITALQYELSDLRVEMKNAKDRILFLGLEVKALQESDHLTRLLKLRQMEILEGESTLNKMYNRKAHFEETLKACRKQLSKLEQGDMGDPQMHINARLRHVPEPPIKEQSRVVEIWAALSSGLLLIVLAFSLIANPGYWVLRVSFVLIIFVAIESAVRKKFAQFLLNGLILLAIATALILAYEFLNIIAVIGLLGLARLLIVDNLRELRNR